MDVAKIFDQIDTDKSGTLTLKELKRALAALGMRGELGENELLAKLDTNEDGQLSFTEIDAMMSPARAPGINPDGEAPKPPAAAPEPPAKTRPRRKRVF